MIPSRRARLAFALAAALAVEGSAGAHGGVPIAQAILFSGDTLVVPTKFWGVFLGTDGGQFHWICEEAINMRQARRWAYAQSGAYHVTDYSGLTSSRDGGCTWVAATGDIATRETSWVLADPSRPHRAWATTDSYPPSPAPGDLAAVDLAITFWNGVFVTDDDGVTWTAALKAGEAFRGVAVSADGQRVYATSYPFDGSSDVTTLHVSRDAGQTWSSVPLGYRPCNDIGDGAVVCGGPLEVEPIGVDPADADTVYLRVVGDPTAVLLRARSDGTASEVVRADGTVNQPGIGTIEFIPEQQILLVATFVGLYRSTAGGPAEKIGNLAQTQCIVRHGETLYACANNYAPDSAAIARAPLADVAKPGGPTFTKVFQYGDSCGPVASCGAGTEVGVTCPGIWANYADQLGASTNNCMAAPDGGGSDGGNGGKGGGCGCALGARRRAGGGALMPGFAFLALVLVLALARRRRAPRTRLAG